MTWQKGASPNPGGRRKEKPFLDALRMEMLSAERGEPCPAPVGSLRWNARKLLETGEIATIRELADRLDGKVPQGIVGDDEADPISFMVRHEQALKELAADDQGVLPPLERG